jgi:solute carrier family 10 (sodium/bile acid cotransporter), member 7
LKSIRIHRDFFLNHPLEPLCKTIVHFRKYWFLYGLGVALAAGFLAHQPVRVISQLPGVRSSLVATVLFLMGLTLSLSSVARCLRYPGASMLALGLNILALPLLAAVAAKFLPWELGAGLIVVAAVPCTLPSASVWTRKGGGNDAIAMLVTLVTNLGCFLIAPLTLRLLIGQAVEIDVQSQVKKLALLVVLPLIVAQLLRLRKRIGDWADRRKVGISAVAQVGILLMVAIGCSAVVERIEANPSASAATNPVWIIITAIFALSIHLVVLLGGWEMADWMGLRREDKVAVAISGSQKTLMVGLQLAIDCGVSVLPMIMYHVGQLIIDTIWVQRIHRPADPKPDARSNSGVRDRSNDTQN